MIGAAGKCGGDQAGGQNFAVEHDFPLSGADGSTRV
jgi:hypothetical protein